MTRADRELRELRRELLLLRAAAERAALVESIDDLQLRASKGLPGMLLDQAGRSRSARILNLAARGIRLLRRQPWLIPSLVGGVARLARFRPLRWAALAALVAAGAWWLGHRGGGDSSADITPRQSIQS